MRIHYGHSEDAQIGSNPRMLSGMRSTCPLGPAIDGRSIYICATVLRASALRFAACSAAQGGLGFGGEAVDRLVSLGGQAVSVR